MDAYSQTRRRQRSDPHVIPCCLCPISSRVWLSVELVCSVFSRKIKVIPRPAIKIYPWKPDDPFRRIWSFSVSMATVAAIQVVFPHCCLTRDQTTVEVMKIWQPPSKGPMHALPRPSMTHTSARVSWTLTGMDSVPGPGGFHMPRSKEARVPQTTSTEALEPVLCNRRSRRSEKPTHHN
ncbi:uncharacterized protein ACBT57_019208 isoform 2-T2 [Dama dama]